MTYRRVFFSEDVSSLKASFDEFYNQASLHPIRIGLGCIVGLTLFDALVAALGIEWWQHFLFTVPVFIAAFALSFAPFFRKHGQVTVGTTFVLVAAGYMWLARMNYDAGIPQTGYHIRLVLCVIAAAAVRLRSRSMMAASSVILILYFIFATGINEISFNNWALGGVCTVACVLSVSNERIMEDQYTGMVLLESERARLKKISEKLVHSDTLKGKLLSIITHDLKGPTQNTAAILKLLNSGQLTQDEFVTHLRKLETQLSGNQIILESLLKWSVTKIDDRVNREVVDLRNLVNECASLVSEAASRKRNTIINDVKSIEICTDPEIVRIILRNLLSNAVKYTEDGTITCGHQHAGHLHVLTVQDTGVGMTQENVDRLFDWTRRISTRGTWDEKGTGIGLLISGEFLECIGGSIQIRSTPGVGTTVSVELRA